MADRRRDARQRRARRRESRGRRSPCSGHCAIRGTREQQLLGDQVADAGVDQRRAARAPLHVVVLGPRGDRHRAERVAGDDRALARRERTSRAPPRGPRRSARASSRRSDGRLALPVTAQVVGDDAIAARRSAHGSRRSSTRASRSSRARARSSVRPRPAPKISACSCVPSRERTPSGPARSADRGGPRAPDRQRSGACGGAGRPPPAVPSASARGAGPDPRMSPAPASRSNSLQRRSIFSTRASEA